MNAFAMHGRQWAAISAYLPGRCGDDVMKRYTSLSAKEGLQKDWTEEEDNKLKKAVRKYSTRDMKVVAREVGGRSMSACSKRWLILSKNTAAGTVEWSPEVSIALPFVYFLTYFQEDALLTKGVEAHGSEGKWSAIAATIAGKTGRECRMRWNRYLSRVQNANLWSKNEDAIMVNMHENGAGWDQMYHHLPGRTIDAIKQRSEKLGLSAKWSLAEVEALKKAVVEFEGPNKKKNWKKIAQQVQTKSAVACSNYFHLHFLY